MTYNHESDERKTERRQFLTQDNSYNYTLSIHRKWLADLLSILVSSTNRGYHLATNLRFCRGNKSAILPYNPPGAVARSDARPPGMGTVAGSILTSGKTFFR